MHNLFKMATSSDAAVLIEGPTGSGKTRLARKIHEASRRSKQPFVCVNLATLNGNVIESELFGHMKGAFTGALNRNVGFLTAAHEGTVFLDEIGVLPLELQPKLLEFLQSYEVSAVGSPVTRRLNVRIIAATNQSLEKRVRDGAFREDLFHRLRVIHIQQPSLEARASELDRIVRELIVEISTSMRKSVFSTTEEVGEIFRQYSWPGNIREMRNILEFAVISAKNDSIAREDLPTWFMEKIDEGAWKVAEGEILESRLGDYHLHFSRDYHGTMAQVEREYLSRALAHFRGRVNRTAHNIGLNKTTLKRRIRAYGLMT